MKRAEPYPILTTVLIVFFQFLSCSVFLSSLHAQQTGNSAEKLAEYLQNADIEKIAVGLDDFLSLETPDKKGSFNKTQAISILKQFFADFPADSVKHVESGQAGAINEFAIGNYFSKGQRFYYYTLSRKEAGQTLIFTFNIKRL